MKSFGFPFLPLRDGEPKETNARNKKKKIPQEHPGSRGDIVEEPQAERGLGSPELALCNQAQVRGGSGRYHHP